MAFSVVLTQTAADDIEAAVKFIASHSLPAAQRWLDDVQTAVESLEEMPLRAAKIPEAHLFRRDYRHLIYKAHRIIFRVDESIKTVFIVRVYHSSRSPLQTEDLS